jgi:pimeloyl-ACP methyl ester carboxylesterase
VAPARRGWYSFPHDTFRRARVRRVVPWLLVLGLLFWLGWDVRPHATAPAPHQAEWLQAGDIRLRVVRAGEGDTTLLLLHGYGESLMGYRAVFDALARRYRVIAVDLPGFGLSDKPDLPYDLASYRHRLGDFLGRWTRGPVVVVGHSMGGEIAAALALDHPDRVVAAVLIAPAGFALQPFIAGAKDVGADARGWVASMLSAAMPPQDPAWLSEPPGVRNYTPATDPAYRAAATRVLADFDFLALRDSFGDIHQPVLLIWGRQDPTIPFAVGESIAARLPCREFLPLDNVLHRPHQTHPDTVVAAIEDFLRHPTCEAQ